MDLDSVLSLEPGANATATKVFNVNDGVFAGHFPGNPIVPGHILIEALAQLFRNRARLEHS